MEIKPCPFCASNRVKLHQNFDYVYCENCGARGSYFDGHPDDAISAWNRVAKKSSFSMKLDPPPSRNRRIIADGTQGMVRGE